MFTSEPSLAQRIDRMIGDVPIVDTRSHLDPRQLQAPDLAALIAERPVQRVLAGVGMPLEALDPDRPADQRVVAALPFLRQVRNTSAAWCLFRIFRDLYDFDEPHLTLENYGKLLDRVAQTAADPAWGVQILQKRARIQTLLAPMPDPQLGSSADAPDFIQYWLEIVGAAGDDAPEGIRSIVFGLLDELLEGRVRFASFGTTPNLSNRVHQAVLEWHQLHQWPIQLVIPHGMAVLPGNSSLEQIQREYPDARFAILTSSPKLAPDAAMLAGQYPNVFAEGYDVVEANTMGLEQNILARVQQAGATKIGGFASGATSAEWVYGSLLTTRKATASALAQVVAGGYLEEDEIPPLLQAMFSTSPIAWYRLQD